MLPRTPATIQRTRLKRLHERVERYVALITFNKRQGDYKTAAEFTTQLLEAQDEIARLDPMGTFHRDVFSARTRHALASETHVIVGDHEPEPRSRFAPSNPERWLDCRAAPRVDPAEQALDRARGSLDDMR